MGRREEPHLSLFCNDYQNLQGKKITYIGRATGTSQSVKIDNTYDLYIVVMSNTDGKTRYTFSIPYNDLVKDGIRYASGFYANASDHQAALINASTEALSVRYMQINGNERTSVSSIDVYGLR